MVCWCTCLISGLSIAGIVALFVWFKRKSTRSFKVDMAVQKEDIFQFLTVPANLEKVHPSITRVCNPTEEDSRIYFEVEETVTALIGKKRVSLSLSSHVDEATSKSHIRLETHNSIVKVVISLTLSNYNPLEKIWASVPPTPKQSDFPPRQLLQRPPTLPPNTRPPGTPPSTPPPSPTTSVPHSPGTSVRGVVEVTTCWGVSHMISAHLARVWKTTLSATESHLTETMASNHMTLRTFDHVVGGYKVE